MSNKAQPGGSIAISLDQLEQKWLTLLMNECNRCFEGSFLPSHDGSHHTRVWNYAKQILLDPESSFRNLNQAAIEILLVACFFHDTGMCIDPGPHHGSYSSNLCSAFLKKSGYSIQKPEILCAVIARHDLKDAGMEHRKDDVQNRLLTLLHLADDLDALGPTGIYRYTEISLVRKVPSERIPFLVLPNLENRFKRMEEVFTGKTDFFTKHKARFLYAKEFFLHCTQSKDILSDFIYFASKVKTRILEDKLYPDEFAQELIQQTDTPQNIGTWANDFLKEWA